MTRGEHRAADETERRRPPALPSHSAEELTEGGAQAVIMLRDQPYVLRITRQGKLLLTK